MQFGAAQERLSVGRDADADVVDATAGLLQIHFGRSPVDGWRENDGNGALWDWRGVQIYVDKSGTGRITLRNLGMRATLWAEGFELPLFSCLIAPVRYPHMKNNLRGLRHTGWLTY